MAEPPPPSPAPTLFRDSLQSPADISSGYDSSNDDDHFSDAHEGRSDMDDSDTIPSPTIPIPLTVVSTLHDTSHVKVPGTEVFEKQSANASADIIKIIDEAETPKERRSMNIAIPGAFGGSDCDADEDDNDGVESTPDTPRSGVPIKVVEKVDDVPSHGEISGETEFKKRLVDAQPNVVRSPSPIPTMVVQMIERDNPNHGEIPGIEAYEKRAADAQPDVFVRWNEEEDRIARRVQTQREEIEEMVQDGGTPAVAGRARSVSPCVSKNKGTPYCPVHGRTRSASPSLGGVSHSVGKIAEATTGDGKTGVVNGGFLETPISKASLPFDLDTAGNDIPNSSALSPTFSPDSGEHPAPRRRKSSAASRKRRKSSPASPAARFAGLGDYKEDEDAAKDDGGFGDDDFEDFGEVVEGEEFGDFGGFGETTEVEARQAPSSPPPPPPPIVMPSIPVPVLDHKELGSAEAIKKAVSESLEVMFPTAKTTTIKPIPVEDSCFLTERSLSLWNQLVAPPPLQPPNWKVSRIRRLFLVSLGVPVDLDEILPAETKQKKLVLPSINSLRRSSGDESHRARRSSSQSRSSRPSSRARKAAADDKIRNGGIGPEALDIPGARILCSKSDVALSGLTVGELQAHVKDLEKITRIAGDVLTYWLRKREGAVGDKETFETVIESLVGYARKKRQNG